MQQALGSLLKRMQPKEFNIDCVIQSVRNIFSMPTKALDQVGCTGECHHIVRRKSAVSDSCLNSLKDVQAKVLYLPLTGDRVSSKSLEDSFEKIKEQKEHITDLTHQNEIFLFRENNFLLMTQTIGVTRNFAMTIHQIVEVDPGASIQSGVVTINPDSLTTREGVKFFDPQETEETQR